MSERYTFPKGEIDVYTERGREYLDAKDLERWLRETADSLGEQGCPVIAVRTVVAIADALAQRPAPK